MSILFSLLISLASFNQNDRWDASRYSQAAFVQRAWTMESINAYYFSGKEKILDLCCGDGWVTTYLSEHVPRGSVLGIDISSSMIEHAQRYSKDHLHFELQDATLMEFQECFDLVTGFFALEWVHDKSKLLQRASASLVKGGRLWLLTPSRMPDGLTQAAEKMMENERWRPYFLDFSLPVEYPTLDWYERVLHDVGLTPAHRETRSKIMLYSSRQSFTQTLRSSFPYLDAVPEDLKDEFLEDIIDCYLQIYPLDRLRRVTSHLEMIEIIAVR